MKRIDPWLAFLLAALMALSLAILLGGCTQTQERSVRVREGVEQGKPTRWVEREQSESKTQVVDPQAIGAAVAEAVKGVVPGADALVSAFKAAAPPPKETDWTQIGAAAGGLATVATTGYLALKKREQLRPRK